MLFPPSAPIPSFLGSLLAGTKFHSQNPALGIFPWGFVVGISWKGAPRIGQPPVEFWDLPQVLNPKFKAPGKRNSRKSQIPLPRGDAHIPMLGSLPIPALSIIPSPRLKLPQEGQIPRDPLAAALTPPKNPCGNFIPTTLQP